MTTPTETTQQSEHTPLPWRVRDGRDRGMGIWVDAPNAAVENDRGPSYPRQILEDEDYPEKAADAALIVTAVNGRPNLLARIERLEEALRKLDPDLLHHAHLYIKSRGDCLPHFHPDDIATACEIASRVGRAALTE